MSGTRDIPSWLEAVLADSARPAIALPDQAGWLVRAEPGEIRAALPMDNAGGSARLVLVLESYTDDDPWINACLIGQAVDAAGDKDVRLDPEDTDVSFPVLVETDVVGPLFMVQLGPVLGALDDSLLDELSSAVYGTWDPSLLRRRGLPIMSRAEARWRLKEDEIAAMHSLGSHCLAHHLTRETDVSAVSAIVDPALLEPKKTRPPLSGCSRPCRWRRGSD